MWIKRDMNWTRTIALNMMKDGVILLNFARDALVDDDAMIEALEGNLEKRVEEKADEEVL